MKTNNSNPMNSTNDPVWHLLAEFQLSELLPDRGNGYERTAGWLGQSMRALGIPPDYHEYIGMILKGYAKQVQAQIDQGSFELTGRIRVFCQGTKMDSAWGYYVIERGRDPASFPGEESRVIELYFYKEGT